MPIPGPTTYPSASLFPSAVGLPAAPLVIPRVDAAPCPRVEIVAAPLPADARYLTVWRAYQGRSDVVRGAALMPIAGDTSVIDYEAPFGVDVTYTYQTFDIDGTPSQISEPSQAVRLDVPDVWAQDPLNPARSMPWPLDPKTGSTVMVVLGSLTGYSMQLDQSPVGVIGSRLPVGQASVLSGLQSLPVIIEAGTRDEQNAVQALLDQALVVCLRTPATIPLIDPVSYWQFGQATVAVSVGWQWVTWTLSGTQVRSPSLNVILPVRTYDVLFGEADTYDNLSSLYDTYLDATRGITSS